MMESWSLLLLFRECSGRLGLASRVFLPEHNRCPLTRIKCGAEKVELGHRTNTHATWSCTGFPEEHPSSGFTAGHKDVNIATGGALKQHTALEVHIRQKMTSKDCHMRGKIPCECRWIPVKDQLLPWAQRLAFVDDVLDVCSQISR